MLKIKVEGPSAKLVAKMIDSHLEKSGLKTSLWWDVKPGEVRECRAKATREKADASILAMTK